jgi:hypothetical protein
MQIAAPVHANRPQEYQFSVPSLRETGREQIPRIVLKERRRLVPASLTDVRGKPLRDLEPALVTDGFAEDSDPPHRADGQELEGPPLEGVLGRSYRARQEPALDVRERQVLRGQRVAFEERDAFRRLRAMGGEVRPKRLAEREWERLSGELVEVEVRGRLAAERSGLRRQSGGRHLRYVEAAPDREPSADPLERTGRVRMVNQVAGLFGTVERERLVRDVPVGPQVVAQVVEPADFLEPGKRIQRKVVRRRARRGGR